MPRSPEQPGIDPRESRETEKERPNLTVYLMGHGESEEDKTNPNRGLTEKGKEQVAVNFGGIIDQITMDELPDVEDIDNPEKRKEAILQALSKVELHLSDSDTYRTSEQVWQQRQMLIELGVPEENK